jgi:exodeoxyribonuclease V alpha subunit
MLNHSFRFDQNSGIGKLSKMVNRAAKNNALLSQFKQGQLADALWLITDVKQNLDGQRSDKSSRFIGHVSKGSPEDFQNAGEGRVQGSSAILPPIGYQAYLAMLMRAETTLDQFSSEQQWNELAQNVIACFERFQVLCAMRNGPYGVEALNLLIQNALIPRTVLVQQGAFYQGRPVLVTRNDYNLGLTNGDIGMVIWRWTKDAKGHCEYAPRVAFPSDTFSDAIRWFSPSRLQSIDTVFAMTVHKSQGSEFEHTCFVLPERINPVVTKELVYTAITRAKYWLSIVSPNENILSNAMNNPISRESGLMLEE